VIAERSRRLRDLARAKSLAFRRGLVGEVRDVLVLGTRERERGRLLGLTGSYVEVVFAGPDALMGAMTRVHISGLSGERVVGEPL
jgi:tRNA A37 methylthiotransferase MiaB